MADEDQKDAPKTKPPQAPPPIIAQMGQGEGRQWVMLLIYLVIALVVAGAVVLGGRWVYNSVTDNEPAQETTTTSDREPEQPAPGSTNQPATPPQTPPPPTPTPTPPSQTQGGQITNTGPGDVVALFIAATLAAAGLHYIYQLRKANQ